MYILFHRFALIFAGNSSQRINYSMSLPYFTTLFPYQYFLPTLFLYKFTISPIIFLDLRYYSLESLDFTILFFRISLESQGQGFNEEGSSWKRAVHLKQGQGQGQGPSVGKQEIREENDSSKIERMRVLKRRGRQS